MRVKFRAALRRIMFFNVAEVDDAEKGELVIEPSDERMSTIQGFRTEVEAVDGFTHFLWNSCERWGLCKIVKNGTKSIVWILLEMS